MATESEGPFTDRRPSRREAASSPTAVSNLFASALLLAGFFLPHSMDCDDRSHRPIEIARGVVAESGEAGDYLALVMLWPYAFGSLTFLVVTMLVVVRPSWFARALFAIPVVIGGLLAIVWLLLLFSGASGSRMAMVMAAAVLPVGACVLARMVWLYRSGNIVASACWGQAFLCLLAAFSLRWFWFPPITRLLWGGILSIAAMILMMAAAWICGNRAGYDLHDRSSRPPHSQLSLRQLMLAVTFVAIALTYWRVLGTQ